MKTYPLTQEQFAALRTRLLENGITLDSDRVGEIAFKGIELKYFFDDEQQRLTLSILKKPFLIPAGEIWKQVDGWVNA